jgi:hypothetical protein
MGYWLVHPYSALRGHPRLKISASGVISQRDRCSTDYLFSAVLVTPFSTIQYCHSLQHFLQFFAYSKLFPKCNNAPNSCASPGQFSPQYKFSLQPQPTSRSTMLFFFFL